MQNRIRGKIETKIRIRITKKNFRNINKKRKDSTGPSRFRDSEGIR